MEDSKLLTEDACCELHAELSYWVADFICIAMTADGARFIGT